MKNLPYYDCQETSRLKCIVKSVGNCRDSLGKLSTASSWFSLARRPRIFAAWYIIYKPSSCRASARRSGTRECMGKHNCRRCDEKCGRGKSISAQVHHRRAARCLRRYSWHSGQVAHCIVRWLLLPTPCRARTPTHYSNPTRGETVNKILELRNGGRVRHPQIYEECAKCAWGVIPLDRQNGRLRVLGFNCVTEKVFLAFRIAWNSFTVNFVIKCQSM